MKGGGYLLSVAIAAGSKEVAEKSFGILKAFFAHQALRAQQLGIVSRGQLHCRVPKGVRLLETFGVLFCRATVVLLRLRSRRARLFQMTFVSWICRQVHLACMQKGLAEGPTGLDRLPVIGLV